MKKYLAIILLNSILGYLIFIPSQRSAGDEILNQNEIPASIGTKDEPRARFLQEFMMLRDPVTNEIPKNIFYLEREFAKTLPKREYLLLNKNSGSDETTALTWTARGPNNVGGRTRALGIDKRTGTPPNVTILAGGVSGGIWRSTDDGSTWNSVTSPSQLHSVTCLVQDQRSGNEDIWYAGTGEAVGNSASGSSVSNFRGDGVFKSTDNGLTWSVISSTSTNTPQSYDQVFDYVHNIVIDPSNSSQDEIYVAASSTIQRSTDGGTNWTTELGSGLVSFISDVKITSNGVVYAAISKYPENTDKGIWRSPDGVTWTNISDGVSGFPTTQFGRITIGIAPSDENIVYFLIEFSNTTPATNGHQLWKYNYISDNGSGSGGSWVNRGGNLPDEIGGSAGNDPFDTQDGYDMFVQVSPNDTDFVIAASTNLYTSTDGFASTSNYDRVGGYAGPDNYTLYANHHPDLHSGAFLPGSDLIYYSGGDGGVHKTSDITATTVSWTSLNTGYNTSQFYSISLAPESDSDTLMGGTQDNGTWLGTSSGLSSWTSVESGDGTIVEVAPTADDKIYTAYQIGGLRRRTRAGTFLADFTPSSALNQLFVNPLVLDPNNSSLMYYAGGTTSTNTGIWRCNPKTATASSGWTSLSSTIISSDQVSAVGISTTTSTDVLYYGTKSGVVKRVDGANSGSSPTVTDVSTGLPSGYVNCLAVDPTNSDYVIAVFSNYSMVSLWYSTNGGSSWTDVEGNLSGATGPSVRWATIFYVSGTSHYFLGTSIGVYFTNTLNGGSTVWTQEAVSSVGNTVTVMLDWRDNDGTLAAATHGKGVYTTLITSPLPVELSSFSGIFQNGKVKLLWKTETEVNNYGFEILRFAQNNGHSEPDLSGEESWEKIGFVEGHGNSNSPKSYEFVDKNVLYGKHYYRLKQIDNDGSFEYSDVVEVDVPTLQDYVILEQNYPNPFNPETKIRFVVNDNTHVSLKIFDAVGTEIAEIFNNIVETGKTYEIIFDGSLISSGVYYYSLTTGNHKKIRKMLLLK
ncbi:MAG: T9SS type A sorting domain-containing protein [Bacteroidetes bacterium]|nr:T9SS type A sorting domain-containing protein [Bacteroidota bacterium]